MASAFKTDTRANATKRRQVAQGYGTNANKSRILFIYISLKK